ncbi:MAG: SDR family oxidoreductase [Lachnospiraceae bacterium]|nr:SDR family oxidoreductase [Lachnospiraceae bacterium]
MSGYALVTGASRGIGKAIAEALAGEGYNLYLTCLNSEDTLREYSLYLSEKYGVIASPSICDMGDYKAVEKLFSGINSLDILVNNAGVSHFGLMSDTTPEEWDMIIRTNLSSVFYASRLAVPLMLRKGKGSIVNISSVWGEHGSSMETAYSASKGGVNAFTKALARELAPSGIRVNALSLGMMDTDMNRHFSKEEIEDITEQIPSGRMGTPKEAAEAVISIIKAPSYLTGQIITLDGGWC